MNLDNKVINLVSQHDINWIRQFPLGKAEWGGYKFIFNSRSKNYEWLVVFDDLDSSFRIKSNFQKSIHIATEPPTIVRYDKNFLKQFSYIVQIQDNSCHRGAIDSPIGLNWHLGLNKIKDLNFEELDELFDHPKTKLISVICSNKAITKEHIKRINFVNRLKEHYGDLLDVYGRGFNTIEDKVEALKDYRFHIVLENSSYNNYFTEKITDCILSGVYPLYYGCPNLEKYFPKGSFLRINPEDFCGTILAIDQAIEESFDLKYKNELIISKNKIQYEYNVFPLVINLIKKIEKGKLEVNSDLCLLNSDYFVPYNSEDFKLKYSSKIIDRLRSFIKIIKRKLIL